MTTDTEQPRKTTLGLLIDPDKQSSEIASKRAKEFLINGGSDILIGGSGFIADEIFTRHVKEIVAATEQSSPNIYIFPGSINQLPESNYLIKGVFYYQEILGSPNTRNKYSDYISQKLLNVWRRKIDYLQIQPLRTLYVLCGPASSSVALETAISPIDTNNPEELEQTLPYISALLTQNLDAVFIEGGSGSSDPVDTNFLWTLREMINSISPRTLLITGGGISEPSKLKGIKGVTDMVVVGNYFEQNPISSVKNFLYEL